MIVPFGNLVDILADIDPGRAGPLAGCGTFLGGIFFQNPPCYRRKVDNVLRADPFAGAATGASFFNHLRQPLGPHNDGIKGACPGAGAETETTHGTNLHPAVQHGCRPAVVQTVVDKLNVCIRHAVSTTGFGDIRLLGFNGNTHDTGNDDGRFLACRNAGVRCRFPGHDRLCVGTASGQAASSAVGSG